MQILKEEDNTAKPDIIDWTRALDHYLFPDGKLKPKHLVCVGVAVLVISGLAIIFA